MAWRVPGYPLTILGEWVYTIVSAGGSISGNPEYRFACQRSKSDEGNTRDF